MLKKLQLIFNSNPIKPKNQSNNSTLEHNTGLNSLENSLDDHPSKYKVINTIPQQQQQQQIQVSIKELHKLVIEYRNSLKQYQLKVDQQLFQKERANQILQQEIIRLNAKNQILQKKYLLIQQSHSSIQPMLQTIPNFHSLLLKTQSHSTFQYNPIHQQLEELIHKLVKQLQHERNLKNNFKDQVKRLNHQVNEFSKQIMNKNNKIYLLELNAIKKQRTYQKKNSIDDTNQSFTLIDLLNNQMNLTFIEKLYIAWKILEFYQKKIIIKDYGLVMVEDIIIKKFNTNNYNLITINSVKEPRDYRKQQSGQYLLLNMVFILDTLINQVADCDQQITYLQSKKQLSQILKSILGSTQKYHQNPMQKLKNQIQCIINRLSNS